MPYGPGEVLLLSATPELGFADINRFCAVEAESSIDNRARVLGLNLLCALYEVCESLYSRNAYCPCKRLDPRLC